MADPQRLLDDPTLGASLRADLMHARAAGLVGFDVTAGAASLGAAIATETGAAPIVAAAKGGGLSKGLIAAVVGVASAGAIAWAVMRGGPEPRVAVPAAPTMPSSNTAPMPAAVPAVAPTTEKKEEQQQEPDSDPAALVPDAPSHPVVAAEPVAPAPAKRKRTKPAPTEADYLREAKLIAEARRAMKTEPKRALSLLGEAKSEFPRGLLREEREALTVLSLSALGRTEQARTSAERFLEKHGEGPYADAVRQVLR
ncbi:MAG: hypothetical protein ACE37F_08575 [Nannocystaceae bacterium]|nr:hypothetical protein [bacterium]